jgi:septum formation protein
MQLILGSASARRREILNYFSIPFRQVPSDFDEESVVFDGDPQKYALTLAKKKANVLASQFPDELILSADTVVFFQNRLYNKPRDAAEAFQFLSELAGNWHQVYTALTIQKGEIVHSAIEETKILFHPLSAEQIHKYHAHIHFLDKAGGYAIQQCGSIVVASIVGCYYNVMGLPVNALKNLLKKMDIDLWNYLKDF